MKESISIRELFSPVLFWDSVSIDPVKHSAYVIERILDYGNERDIRKLRDLYDDETIIEVVKTRRGLSERTRNFWRVYFRLPLEDCQWSKE